MPPTETDPFATMRALTEEMDRLFGSFGLGNAFRPWSPLAAAPGAAPGPGTWSPQVDVTRHGDEIVVCADVPGMKREDLHAEVREDRLILQGERRQEHQAEEGGVYRRERGYGRFERTIPLPQGIDPEQARASFRDGVLEIRMPLPRPVEPRARRIEIGAPGVETRG